MEQKKNELADKGIRQKETSFNCGFTDCGGCSPEQAGRCLAIAKRISGKVVESQKCRTCVNAFPIKPGGGVVTIGEWFAECHAFPPGSIVLPSGQVIQGKVSLNIQAKWPLVFDKPGFFCGCWTGAADEKR
jgi:hypothetical protein